EGIHIYKAFNMKKQFAPKFEDACEDVAQESYKIARKKSYGLSLNVLNTLVPQILTYAIGLTFVIRKLLTVGELVIFANMLALFLNAFQQITNNWQDILVKEGLARHFFELLDEDEERTDGEDYTEAQSEIAIEFRNVSFKYNESQHVLKDISFTIEKGEKVALVGMSGSGKTTIHKLICGFYEDYEGEIRVNGKNIRDWNYESLRKNLSIVTQDVFLFDSTIKENIRYGRVGASDEEIVIGAKMAYAHDFIEELESGYETKAGERGGSLSGGQKQRIAIARAILDNAPILLLDEPTSALDTKSEHYINLALEQLEEGKTSLVIAHRLSTIETAQKIIVIEDGYVVETGTHQELIKNQSRYSDLYQRQIQTDKREGQNEK
ncbi:MAG: ABC transporter ATP-binding protein, partial [Clostridiales bacterium]|nr:ABC transporter ATP-binding protein [Clostridiales bacterium]